MVGNFFNDTGLPDGNECEKIISNDGIQDVDPSKYPTGCPNNYSDPLSNITVKS